MSTRTLRRTPTLLRNLSGGQQQPVIDRAVSLDPEMMLFDGAYVGDGPRAHS